jgi:hypothetical protein
MLRELLLRRAPLVAAHAAMDRHDGLAAAEERADALLEVVEGIAVKEDPFVKTPFWAVLGRWSSLYGS